MQKEKYYNLISEAIKAKEPVEIIYAIILVMFTYALVILYIRDMLLLDYYTFFIVIFYCVLCYKVIINKIFQCIDIHYSQAIEFEGEIIDRTSYHNYRTAPAKGSLYIIKINNKKKKIYKYEPLEAYIKQTKKSKWTSSLVKRGDIVRGSYLKHSKILIEFHPLTHNT